MVMKLTHVVRYVLEYLVPRSGWNKRNDHQKHIRCEEKQDRGRVCTKRWVPTQRYDRLWTKVYVQKAGRDKHVDQREGVGGH